MPKKTRQGWVSPTPEGVEYEVRGHSPSGVFAQYIRGTPPSLEYAGSGTNSGLGFILPDDSSFLRDIATAINNVADDMDRWRKTGQR